MNAAAVSSPSTGSDLFGDTQSLAMQLDALRQLLLHAARAIGAGDAPQVQTTCEELTAFAVNLRPAWGELFPNRSNTAAMEFEQQRQRLLLPLLEARALYLAGLRRWRRSLCLRRSLMEIEADAPAYSDAELSRWC